MERIKMSKHKPTPPHVKHRGHNTMLVRGQWGPHTAKLICRDCDGSWIKWVQSK